MAIVPEDTDVCFEPFSLDHLLVLGGRTQSLEVRSRILACRTEHTLLAKIDEVVGAAGKRDVFTEQLTKLTNYFVISPEYPEHLKTERDRRLQFILEQWRLDSCVVQKLKLSASVICRLLAALEVLLDET